MYQGTPPSQISKGIGVIYRYCRLLHAYEVVSAASANN